MSDMTLRIRIPVDLTFEEASASWHFQVDEPRVVGGGQRTREDARAAAVEAIAFALESERSAPPEGIIEYIDVAVG